MQYKIIADAVYKNNYFQMLIKTLAPLRQRARSDTAQASTILAGSEVGIILEYTKLSQAYVKGLD